MRVHPNRLVTVFNTPSQKAAMIMLFLSLAAMNYSCKEGAVGPAGPAGTVGPAGADGADGENYSNYLQTFPASFAFTNPFSTTATAGSSPWSRVTTTHFGVPPETSDEGKAQSGVTLSNGTSTMGIAVNMPHSGICQFEVSISCEQGFDYVKWFIDGTEVNGISGIGGPFIYYFNVPIGAHTIDFRYIKDGTITAGSDACKVDNILITNYQVGSRMALPSTPVLPPTVTLWSERPAGLTK